METAWIIVGVVIPAALALGGALMADSSSLAHFGACIAFLVAAIWLAIVGTMWWRRKEGRDWTVWLRGAGIAAYVIILTPFLVWVAWPASAQNPPPSVSGNCNNFGNNNFNCNTLNVAPPRLTFTDEVRRLVLTIPKDKPLKVTGVGSNSDCDVAKQIEEFLKANGYDTMVDCAGLILPPQDHALSIRDTPIGRDLIVTPALGR